MESTEYLRSGEIIFPSTENSTAMHTQPDTAEYLARFEAEALPYWSDLYRTARRLLQQPGKASDAVQETYLLAWKSFGSYEEGTNCKAWLFRILINVVRHERRSWFKWITGSTEDVGQSEMLAAPTVSETLSDDAILAALDALATPFREVVLLVDVQEFSYLEAGEILNIPIGTVMSRLSRGRALLREQLIPVATAYGIGVC